MLMGAGLQALLEMLPARCVPDGTAYTSADSTAYTSTLLSYSGAFAWMREAFALRPLALCGAPCAVRGLATCHRAPGVAWDSCSASLRTVRVGLWKGARLCLLCLCIGTLPCQPVSARECATRCHPPTPGCPC
jgi:hypothetical protein